MIKTSFEINSKEFNVKSFSLGKSFGFVLMNWQNGYFARFLSFFGISLAFSSDGFAFCYPKAKGWVGNTPKFF